MSKRRGRRDAAKQGWKTRRARLNASGDSGLDDSCRGLDTSNKKRKLWDENAMIRAMEAVKSGEMGVNRAALEYGVPKTSLKDRISGRVKHGKNPGPCPLLTNEEENELASFLTKTCKMGQGKTKQDVLYIVKRIVEKKQAEKEKEEPFKFSGEGWWQGFMKRHSKLSLRCSDPLSYCRSNAVTKESLDNYFTLLKETLEKNNLMDRNACIYNMDETGMPLDSKQLKRVAPRGFKKVHGPSSGNKTQITILACANAMGNMLPPMVIFKGERFNHDWVKGEVPNTLYGMSPNGWIDQELFTEWLQKLFIPSIPSTRPVLLLLDGHSSHFNPEAIKIAAEAEIILFCLPPHTTHVAQPLDVSFFGPLKKHWSKVCHSYMTDNPGRVVTKFQFCSLLNQAWFKAINPATIISGFRKVGVCPFNATAIQPYSNTLSDENSYSSSNETISKDSNHSLTEKDTEVVSSENSSSHQYTFAEEDICLFQKRFENGYDLYHDTHYVDWLRQEHPDSLPNGLVNSEQVDTSVIVHPCTNNSEQGETAEQNADISTSTSFTSQENESSNDDATSSLSSSLSMTRKLISELSELITPPKTSTGKNKGKAKARVLTSDDSLKELIEKEKKKREEEEEKKRKKKKERGKGLRNKKRSLGRLK